MNSDKSNITLISIILATAIVLYFVLRLSNSIGAEFEVTLQAVMRSTVVFLIVFAFQWLTRISLWFALSLFLAGAWICWWGVLDSIARNVNAPFPLYDTERIWYTTMWFKLGIEAVIVGITTYFILRK